MSDEVRRALLVASTGGHLEQLTRLEKRLSPAFHHVAYATFDDQQSRSLLAGRDVQYVERIPPRGLKEAAGALRPALRILRDGNYTDVVSTGSAIAVPFLTTARVLGMRCHYIESAARSTGPSLTGRIISCVPGVHLYTQYDSWASRQWTHAGSVFDRFVPVPPDDRPRAADRVVVTLGTMRRYPFRRAVEAIRTVLADVANADAEVLWQVGDTPVDDLGIRAHEMVPSSEMRRAIGDADLIFAHAGIGSCLQILDSGHSPVLLPRRSSRGEHIDDHQLLIAKELDERKLAISRDPMDLTSEDAVHAMQRKVGTSGLPQDFQLAY